ncbi:MAG: GntR family transcriptional regulator [Proteobacteria bacterium]|nr:GntR family transcriptional regulator [Pseudomonadota bacterium]
MKARQFLVDEAYRRIKQAILLGEMPPGFQQMEQDLANRLGMSRTPVREAIIRLQSEGLVEFRSRRGMRVLPISPDDIRDLYDLLICLEAQAVERLIENRPTKDQIAALEQTIADMEEALGKDDLERWAANDERFHRLLIEFCGNERLIRVARAIWDQAHRARMVILRLRPRPVNSATEHRAVVAAIRKRNAARAREACRRHRTNAKHMVIGILRDLRLTQL